MSLPPPPPPNPPRVGSGELFCLATGLVGMYNKCDTLPLYNMVHYNTVLDITRFKDGSQNV